MTERELNETNTIRIGLAKSQLRQLKQAPGSEAEVRALPSSSTQVNGQDLFGELLESVYDAIVICSMAGTILRTNDRAQDFFGLHCDEFRGLNIVELLCGASPGTLDWIRENMRKERRVFVECYCNRRDGTAFPAEVTVNIIHISAAGEFCFFIRNISVRKQAEEALKKAQENLLTTAHKAGMADIATGVLHDVGNILNSINVSCEMLAGLLKSSSFHGLNQINGMLKSNAEQMNEFLLNDPKGVRLPQVMMRVADAVGREQAKMMGETDSLRQKVELVRDVIRTQQDFAKQGLFSELVDMTKLVDDAFCLEQSHIANHGITITKECEEDLMLKTQKTKVIYILINLIRNAVDAMKDNADDNRRLTVACAREPGYVRVCVSDNGEGIQEENITNIFTHGFTTKPTGHGFGLHTCANFMKEIGGSISVDSDGPGTGTSFTLMFPAEAEADQGGADND